ncbi:MAG: OB-fold nucleic acid binding domain-containing protein, partial [Patescibacteria group bacterium]|nr:OB-fold nucleic acid binding domain-containing protein [Patescibacteria group bacterium]
DSAEKITCFGYVNSVKEITTKKGDAIAFAVIEDITGSIELIVFPKIYEQYKDFWKPEQLLVVAGKPENRQGKPQIIVDRVHLLSEQTAARAQKGQKRTTMHIRINEPADSGRLDQIKKILYRESGATQVVLHINGTAKLKLPMGINASTSLAQEIKTLVGEDHVSIR